MAQLAQLGRQADEEDGDTLMRWTAEMKWRWLNVAWILWFSEEFPNSSFYGETSKFDIRTCEENDVGNVKEMIEVAHEEYPKDLNGFEKLLIDAEKPLYEGCKKYTKLSTLVKLYNLKVSWSLGRKLGSSKELQSLRVFLKLESSKKACIFKGASIFEGVLEVGVLKESFWGLGRKFVSSKKLQSLRVFLKLKSSKKACIFKEASIFGGRSFDLRGWLTSGVEKASISWENFL
ncbi:36.4 kDa proline-rich protein-like [Cucumis melo var. makuwa]|uniref:36.4 kDa proline-rich protein-like n=1 Tax=Cucumis melo var. makuwa TaxID=1194695 RepID=A0A5D3DQU4_CUCMM|nr:36.4 kDa proline-rich protein-like [Cucumis melo var. makuwa]